MERKLEKSIKRYGLLGKNIAYSFSKNYFTQKFKTDRIHNCIYQNFDIADISCFREIITKNIDLKGLNITIPYKEKILPFLNELSPIANTIGAVNTIEFASNGHLIGHNTDYFGFLESLKPLLENHHKKALILGTGGASKAVKVVFKTLHIPFLLVSRKLDENYISYSDLNKGLIMEYPIIINTTPLGTYPNVGQAPDIPYQFITSKNLLYDLTYNPSETTFLKNGIKQGAKITNGLKMLILQAEKSWSIWNKQS